MKLIFVRHGHPNYEKDCLTELGHLHAEAAAERLKDAGIEKIFSSSCGRAVETAEHTAKKIGLQEVTQFDFMREVIWGYTPEGYDAAGHPWNLVDEMIRAGKNLKAEDWKETAPFKGNCICECTENIAKNLDIWLSELGYTREGDYYRVGEVKNKTVALFSHGGSSTAALAHLFSLPFPYILGTVRPDFTAITVVNFSDVPGTLTIPEFELLNDSRHIAGIEAERFYGH